VDLESGKMAETFKVAGYDGFVQFMKNLNAGGKIVNVLFTGAKDEKVRIGWGSEQENLEGSSMRRIFGLRFDGVLSVSGSLLVS
jgi:hypothetical protein